MCLLPLAFRKLLAMAKRSFTGFLWSRASGTEFLGKDIFAAAVSPDCAYIISCSKQWKSAQVTLRTSSKDGGVVQVQQNPCVGGSWLVQSRVQAAIGLIRVRKTIVKICKGLNEA